MAWWQHAITLANGYPVVCSHMEPLGHSELKGPVLFLSAPHVSMNGA